jgi:transposase
MPESRLPRPHGLPSPGLLETMAAGGLPPSIILTHLITPIATTPGPTADGATTPQIHAALQQRGLLPGTPLVDTGVLDADLFVQSRDDDGVDLLGPTRLDSHGQAQAGAGCDAQHCQSVGDRPHAPCPAGQTRISWTPALANRQHAVMKVKCSTQECRGCDPVTPWSRSPKPSARRTLTSRPQPHYQALQAARQREATAAFRAE